MIGKKLLSSWAIIPLFCRNQEPELISVIKPEDRSYKFIQDGEINGRRSKGDRKRNPRWRRQ
ncbi:MAG: hypothetical protein MK214_16470 [Thalassotalea sp.]|nr:hypothetical protein [Thalassotalea sp.]